ncbi:MAG TPA: tetratricopeptide repeat protein [Acidobacteriota bacterium]|nr:tetratricopeptide repeat protein [Acidobacteriota bacterium]
MATGPHLLRKAILIIGALLVVGSIVCGKKAWAQNPRNEIYGRVTTPDGSAVDHMPVFLLGDDYTELSLKYTDAGGRYHFPGLSQGVFYIKIEPQGNEFYPQTFRIEMGDIMTSGGEKKPVDIQLKPRDAGAASTVAGTGTSVFHQRVPDEARQAYAQGLMSLQRDDFEAAEKSLKRAIQLFPDYYDALDRLGGAYTQRGNCQEAVTLLQHAKEVNKNAWHAYYTLGAALTQLNRREEGIAALKRAVELNPQSPNTNMRLGLELAKNAQTHKDAIQALVRASRLAGKELPDAYFFLASLYTKEQRYAEAVGALEAYLAAVPKVDPSQKEQYRKAIEQLRTKAAVTSRKPE